MRKPGLPLALAVSALRLRPRSVCTLQSSRPHQPQSPPVTNISDISGHQVSPPPTVTQLTMSVSRVLCLTAGLTLWRVLCVAGVFLLVLLPPPPPPPTSLQQRRRCDHRLSSIARRIVHQVTLHYGKL